MIEVVGNARFFILMAGLLFMLVMGSKCWSFSLVALVAGTWLVLNLLLDVALRAAGSLFISGTPILSGPCLKASPDAAFGLRLNRSRGHHLALAGAAVLSRCSGRLPT